MKFLLVASVVFLILAGISLIGGDIDNARFCVTIMMLWYIVYRLEILDDKR